MNKSTFIGLNPGLLQAVRPIAQATRNTVPQMSLASCLSSRLILVNNKQKR
jgi:hypothetical protein